MTETFDNQIKPIRSGVAESFFEEVDWGAHIPEDPRNPTLEESLFQELAERIVHMVEPRGWFVRRRLDDSWVGPLPKTDAMRNALLEWENHGYTQRTIQDFFTKAKSIDRKAVLPVPARFFRVQGSDAIALNRYRDTSLEPALGIPCCEVLPVLRVIKYGLCGEDEFDEMTELREAMKKFTPEEQAEASQDLDQFEIDLMLEQIDSRDQSAFRWLIHWLANIRQNVGINSQTGVILHGASQGVGKGTLCRLIFACLGQDKCGNVNAAEVKRGWTDAPVEKLFCVADEWTREEIVKHTNFFKNYIANPVSAASKRNQGTVDFVNTTSWLITNNENEPIDLHAGDRRFTVIRTTSDAERARGWCEEIWRSDTDSRRHVQAFNTLLCSVEVDRAFVERVLDNDDRQDMIDVSQDRVEQWLESTWDKLRGKCMTASEVYERFETWHQELWEEKSTFKYKKCPVRSFGIHIKQWDRNFEKPRSNSGNRYLFLDQEWQGR